VRILHKLLILLLVVSLVPLAISAVNTLRSMRDIGDNIIADASSFGQAASERFREVGDDVVAESVRAGLEAAEHGASSLEEEATVQFSQLVRDKAKLIDKEFEQVEGQLKVALDLVEVAIAEAPEAHGARFYTNADYAERSRAPGDLAYSARHNMDISLDYPVFNLAPGVERAEVEERMQQLAGLAPTLRSIYAQVPLVKWIFLGTPSGLHMAYPGHDGYKQGYDPRVRSWYVSSVERNEVSWLDPYVDVADGQPLVTCSGTFRDARGELAGVIGADVAVETLYREMLSFKDRPELATVLVTDDGRILVEAGLEGVRAKWEEPISLGQLEAAGGAAGDEILKVFQEGKAGTRHLPYGGEECVWSFAPIPRARWWLAVIVPVEEVVRPAEELKQTLVARQEVSRKLLERHVGTVQADLERRNDELHEDLSGKLGRLRQNTYALVAVVTALVFIVSMFLARRVTKPVKILSDAARRVGKGDLECRVEMSRRDELGELAETFNTMVVGLGERNKMKGMLDRYMSKSLAEEMLANAELLNLGGARQKVTILYADVRGFTPLSERLAPGEVMKLLNDYLAEMIDIIMEHEGTLDNIIGDAVMALYGAPRTAADDAVRAIRTAVAMQERMEKLRVRWSEEGRPELHIRIGLSTGMVVHGNVGSDKRQEYTVIGDAANTAARLEKVAGDYGVGIAISGATYEEVSEQVEARLLGTVNVKGKEQTVEVYEVVGMRDQA